MNFPADTNDVNAFPHFIRGLFVKLLVPVNTRWFKYDRDILWLVYTQSLPVIFEPPCKTIYVSDRFYSTFSSSNWPLPSKTHTHTHDFDNCQTFEVWMALVFSLGFRAKRSRVKNLRMFELFVAVRVSEVTCATYDFCIPISIRNTLHNNLAQWLVLLSLTGRTHLL